VVDCERSTYVLELILALRRQGWFWIEEYIWNKTSCMPGKWKNRFRDAWERCLHFTKSKDFAMYQDEVKVPIGDWRDKQIKQLPKQNFRNESATNSGFGINRARFIEKDMVYPSNVLTLTPTNSNKKHSATFPESLPVFFIKLFTKEGDLVLEPFCGAGTTLVAAEKLKRDSIGIEIKEEYIEIIKERMAATRTSAPIL